MANAKMKQNVPIFVSSTYEDLIPYREEVQRVINRLEQIVRGMEYFGSNSKKPLEVCLETVRSCKIFVGIIGMRYGSLEEESKKSFTQLEYEEAIKFKIPTLIYIINEDYPISPKFVDRDKKAEMLSKFKYTLTKNHTVSYFTSPEDLGYKLASDLMDVLKSLEHITIDMEKEEIIKNDFKDVVIKFIKRPAKYASQEGILKIRVGEKKWSGDSLRTEIQSKLGLTIGDTICVTASVIDEQTLKDVFPCNFCIYGDKQMGDWLEEVEEGTVASVKVRLEYIIEDEIVFNNNNSMIKKQGWSCLVLLDVISEAKK